MWTIAAAACGGGYAQIRPASSKKALEPVLELSSLAGMVLIPVVSDRISSGDVKYKDEGERAGRK